MLMDVVSRLTANKAPFLDIASTGVSKQVRLGCHGDGDRKDAAHHVDCTHEAFSSLAQVQSAHVS